jgi:glutaredoxin
MSEWTVFSRPGCGLCEEMLEELASVLPPAEAARVQVIDIDADPELTRKYSTRIPVLLVDGEFVCAYRLDKQRVAAHL